MNIRYSVRARAQIELIHNYIARRDASAATVVVAYIRQAASILADWPQLGRTTDEKEVRMLIVPRFPYIVFYIIRPNKIIILRVMHAAQKR